MIQKRIYGDLKIAYRPYKLDEVVGNEYIKKIVSNGLINNTLPHSSLFTGPKGCGKTTFARIIALALNCEKGVSPNPCCVCPTCKSIINMSNMAVQEIDGTRTGQFDFINEVAKDLPYAPLTGERAKVIIVDEAHSLTSKGESALLKPLEDTPKHVYVILCTNKPEKLAEATRDRCRAGTIQFGRLEVKYIFELLEQVAQFEGMRYNKEALEYISNNSDGTPRTALGILQQVNNENSWELQTVKNICDIGVDVDIVEVIDFCKVLLRGDFKATFNAFNKLKKIPPESCRIAILGYLIGCLKRSKHSTEAHKFSKAIDIISQPYYGPKPEHTLLNSCFKISEVIKNG